MPRTVNNRVFELREWQQEAFRATIDAVSRGCKDFLCVATPGAGKTIFALRVAHHLMREKLCDRIVLVTYTDSLKRQWAATAAKIAGLDIDPDFSNSHGIEASDYHGVAVTYALLGQDKKGIHAQNTFNKRTFVIFDEIHHAGENLTWGDAVSKSFEGAVFRLAISGTAFRSDDNEIPFIQYKNGVSVADYTYSYERSIKENVCRPVYFSTYDGVMKWKVADTEFKHSFKDHLEKDQVSKRLRTALDPKGNWVSDVMRAADAKLSEIRKSHKNAAGLVFAVTQHHAKEIAKVVEKVTGIKPPVVVSDEDKSSEIIEQFRDSSDRWIVSVKMVSEGVDIPRLRVGAYFTNVKAELFFRQAVGRFVRVLRELKYQDAFVFIPKDKDLVKLAETIQEERDHALENGKPNGGSMDGDLFGSNYIPALKGKFEVIGSEATEENTIHVNVGISSGMKTSVQKSITGESPVYLQKKAIRERLNLLAKKIALKKRNGSTNEKPDFKFAHKQWMLTGGKNMELETIPELKVRVKFYENMLRN